MIHVTPLTNGLINNTWKISSGEEEFILQRINTLVFAKPYELAENIRKVAQHLKAHSTGYLFVTPLATIDGQDIFHDPSSGYFRLFPFIKGSHTIDVVSSADEAYEAAFQFGKFTWMLSNFDVSTLNITIPDFHNLSFRYAQFKDAINNGNSIRITQAAALISEIEKHAYIADTFNKIEQHGLINRRVAHHDTKISNVLFDTQQKGLCVIDLDTMMPGYFISDVGDMMRTYLSPVNEEEKDFSKIDVRDDFFRAIIHGYISSTAGMLTDEEQTFIYYSGLFLIYMQALRFLTDHFNNDIYYGARYENHNLVRAGNQLQLLRKYEEKSMLFQKFISDEFKGGKRTFSY